MRGNSKFRQLVRNATGFLSNREQKVNSRKPQVQSWLVCQADTSKPDGPGYWRSGLRPRHDQGRHNLQQRLGRTSGYGLTLGAFQSGCILRTGYLPSDLARDQVNGGEVCTIDQHQISHATGIGFWNPALAQACPRFPHCSGIVKQKLWWLPIAYQ